MKLITITYPESRLEFFKEQLAAAHRRLDWSIKHNPNYYDHAEKGEVVSFYEWAVQMAESDKNNGCKYCDDLDVFMETVCYIPTDNGGAIDIPVNCCPACGRKLSY